VKAQLAALRSHPDASQCRGDAEAEAWQRPAPSDATSDIEGPHGGCPTKPEASCSAWGRSLPSKQGTSGFRHAARDDVEGQRLPFDDAGPAAASPLHAWNKVAHARSPLRDEPPAYRWGKHERTANAIYGCRGLTRWRVLLGRHGPRIPCHQKRAVNLRSDPPGPRSKHHVGLSARAAPWRSV
jgi:hypothetical protein